MDRRDFIENPIILRAPVTRFVGDAPETRHVLFENDWNPRRITGITLEDADRFRLLDVKIGNMSQFACVGDIAGECFSRSSKFPQGYDVLDAYTTLVVSIDQTGKLRTKSNDAFLYIAWQEFDLPMIARSVPPNRIYLPASSRGSFYRRRYEGGVLPGQVACIDFHPQVFVTPETFVVPPSLAPHFTIEEMWRGGGGALCEPMPAARFSSDVEKRPELRRDVKAGPRCPILVNVKNISDKPRHFEGFFVTHSTERT